ncbi:MAG: MurT ligase domain-containing protein [Oscillospiraceae bacterium]|nr:MurT ligase domain-containing protein [Oscillospiraceae bacterium]MDE7171963.1 MurT ligase domain-containing protein [Oscillospiraceae bacterium]
MRLFLAVVVCKILRFIGGLIGKGSSLPGQFALKVCPNVLGRVKLPEHIIAVTGSNGKTSTVEMIAAILSASGQKVVYNKEGSNQIEGVTTLILSNCSLGGKMRGDVLLLESDERYARHTFRFFHPTHFVITNLYRDQLTRNGHPEWVYDAIKDAVFPETTLVLNADDPLVSCFARDHAPDKVKWFGLDECSVSAKEHHGVYHDGARCPVCKGRMEYSCYHYAHIGHYSCPSCGHQRHDTDFAVTALDLKEGKLTINGETEISLAFKSIYNVYNILAAWSVCALAGADNAAMAGVINNYMLKNGRMITFRLGSHRGTLLTSKHENSIAYDTNLAYIAATDKPCTVLVIVDAISRKYFTGETSWLWDIDFDRLGCEHVQKVMLYGKYCGDLAVRFKYSHIPADKIEVGESIATAAEYLKENGDEDVYVVTCFSDRDKLLALVEKD